MLTRRLPPQDLASQIREWRSGPVLHGTLLTHDAWAWLSPKAYSPGRFAVLNEASPRSIALLIAVGEYARDKGLDSVPPDVRGSLRDCFCAAILAADVAPAVNTRGIWMRERPVLEAGKAFIGALPADELSEITRETLGVVESLSDADAVKSALEQLTTANELDAIFICSLMRFYCYTHSDALDIIRPLLRNKDWRDSCAKKVQMMGWELLAEGLLVLQARLGVDWAAELPYILLCLAEACAGNEDKATFFLACLVMSSVSGNTAGALKSLSQSRQRPALGRSVNAVKQRIDELRGAAPPAVRIRLQTVATMFDQV